MGFQFRQFRRLFQYAFRYKWLLAVAVGMGVMGFAVTFVFPWLIGSAIDHVVSPRLSNGAPPLDKDRIHWLRILFVIGMAVALTSAVATYGRGHFSVKLGTRVIADLRQDLFDHLNRLSLHFYSKERTGSIMSRLINDIQQASQILSGGAILLALDLVQIAIGAVLLFTLSWKMALATLSILPLYAITFRILNPKVKVASDRVQSQISKMSGTVQERLSGIALVKASAMEDVERERFRADNEEYYGRVVEQSSVSHLVGAITEGLIHTGTMIVIGMGGWYAVYGNPPMSAGDVVKFLGWIGVMYGPVRHLAEINIVYQTSLAAMERVFKVFDITPKIQDHRGGSKKGPERGEVRFEHVKFRYTDDSDESRVRLDAEGTAEAPKVDGDRWILDDLNFSVAPGERIALVGPSGSGKSTIVSLLPRLYDVSEGRILIDGKDVRDYRLKPLRESIGIVQQQSLMFSGTVRDNLCYGCRTVDQAAVEANAKAANADEFIRRLPGGYDALLGERGVNLSGGQLQRLSIARALLRNPRILILDEATSALDAESEALVQEALERVMKDRTCFIIAHRLSTIRNADRILVLKDGRVTEQGRHDELLALDGIYAQLVRRQFGSTSADRSPLAGVASAQPQPVAVG